MSWPLCRWMAKMLVSASCSHPLIPYSSSLELQVGGISFLPPRPSKAIIFISLVNLPLSHILPPSDTPLISITLPLGIILRTSTPSHTILRSVDSSSGFIRWETSIPSSQQQAPSSIDLSVGDQIILSQGGKLTGLGLEMGEISWQWETPGTATPSFVPLHSPLHRQL